ncbi:MAG TPA: hypothetical protein VGB07_16770 [Blastocatellia bacterium]|jgi:hypothetical protein
MSKEETAEQDGMLPEYDFDQLPVIKRGPGHQKSENPVREPDAEYAEDLPDNHFPPAALR